MREQEGKATRVRAAVRVKQVSCFGQLMIDDADDASKQSDAVAPNRGRRGRGKLTV